jgi:hypothetical protein
MKPQALLLPAQRDLRLDLFRGIANWAIFLGHIPNNALAWITMRNYGFSDGADLFVFVSGYTAAFVYGTIMINSGLLIGATRLLKRIWKLYVAHVLLFVFYVAAVHILAHSFDIPHLMDQFNVAGLMDAPVETLTYGLLLKFKPLNLDVLPLYIVLLGSFPLVLWGLLKRPNWTFASSVLLYIAARYFQWNLPSYPGGVWYFNPFAWQLLFVFGAWLALGGRALVAGPRRSPSVIAISAAYLLFAAAMTVSSLVPETQHLFPAWLFDLFNPNDKTNLAPYRVLHLIALALIITRYIPIDWPGLKWPALDPLIKCGEQSLQVFCVGVFLAFIAHVILEMTSEGIFSQFLASAAGIGIMVGIAYYGSWSKRIDKLHPWTARGDAARIRTHTSAS